MYLGIDVGGTYTDGVIIDNHKVLTSCKVPTQKEELLTTILESLDTLLKDTTDNNIQRIVVSTTLMTNLILENKYEPTGLILIPGSGINMKEFKLPFISREIKGSIDFQGRLVENIDRKEVLEQAAQLIEKEKIKNIGVISKFSSRNPELELQTVKIIKEKFPQVQVKAAHEISGHLNFVRRAMNTALFLACNNVFQNFIKALQESLDARGIYCPVFILKADGGVVPIKNAYKYSVDTILSGPAASCFGAKTFLNEEDSAVVVDIGGTTTDLSLILDGVPLYASQGAKIKNIFTHVRALSVTSLPIGGDTGIIKKDDEITLTFKKEGLPACLGGTSPTVTDCLRVLDLTDLGDKEKALKSLSTLNEEPLKVAREALDYVVNLINQGVDEMFLSWQKEPRYRIWQLLNPSNIKPQYLVALGGPSKSLVNLLSKRMGLTPIYHPFSKIANAIGACLALPNFEESIRINTEKNEISTTWGYFSNKEKLKNKISKKTAIDISQKIFNQYLKNNAIEMEPKIYQYEVFNMVRNWKTTGQIHEIKIGIPPQIMGKLSEEGGEINA